MVNAMCDNITLNCAHCHFSTSLRTVLKRHIFKKHWTREDCKKDDFECSVCGVNFGFKGNLSRHIKHLHSGKSEDKLEAVKCSVCGLVFAYKANMLRHMKTLHPNCTLPKKTFKYVCSHCPRRFNHLCNLKCHLSKAHSIVQPEPLKPPKCPLCADLVGGKMKSLLDHLNRLHGIKVEKELFQFKTYQKFQEWRESIEKETGSTFVKFARRGDLRIEYRCHRSGIFISKSKGIRKSKIQGSKKINGICPASIILYKRNTGFEASFIRNHIGHDNDTKCSIIGEKERLSIACKIACNLPFDTILEEHNNSPLVMGRRLITKKDLYNIRAAYKLSTEKNEDCSLDWWIVDIASANNSCIIFYKSQENKDFVLILINDKQHKILTNCSYRIICLDRSQCLNKFGYELITLYVLHEGLCFPCIFIITNKVEKQDFINHFKLIRDQIMCSLTCEIILTDLESDIFESWCQVMGRPSKRLLSQWHVDWAVRRNIAKVKNKEKQSIIYQSFLNLVKEKDVSSFKTKLDLFLTLFVTDKEAVQFLKFIKSSLIDSGLPWSDSLREQAGFKKNNSLEQARKTIKYIYLSKANINHVNKAVSDIMQFIKDSLLSKFLNLNNVDLKMNENSLKHNEAVTQSSFVQIERKDSWLIHVSESQGNKTYVVNEFKTVCQCPIVCLECSVCLHKYTCSCVDNNFNWNICNHIHLICEFLKTVSENSATSIGSVNTSHLNGVENLDHIQDETFSTHQKTICSEKDIPKNIEVLNLDNSCSFVVPNDFKNNYQIVSSGARSESSDTCLPTGDNPHMDNFIETLDRRKSNLSQKIENLLKYVDNVESVEIIDLVEKLFIPIESQLLSSR